MPNKEINRVYQEFAARLRKACDKAELPERGRATMLGQMVGLTYKGASKWLDGHGMPGMGNATILALKLKVPLEWLMTGRGTSRLQEKFLRAAEEQGHYSNLTPESIEFAQQWQRLSKNTQEQIRQFMIVQSILDELQQQGSEQDVLAQLNRRMQDILNSTKPKKTKTPD